MEVNDSTHTIAKEKVENSYANCMIDQIIWCHMCHKYEY